jgi:hypothetical protein
MKVKSSQTRKESATRKQTGKIHMSATATATGLTRQAGRNHSLALFIFIQISR